MTDAGREVEILASNLRGRREELGLGIEDVAARAGMDADHYGHIEAEPAGLNVRTLVVIARVLDTSPAQLTAGIR